MDVRYSSAAVSGDTVMVLTSTDMAVLMAATCT
jgi:hypothetical protein